MQISVWLSFTEMMFMETSAMTGENVEEAFLRCARSILTKIESGRWTERTILKFSAPGRNPTCEDLCELFYSICAVLCFCWKDFSQVTEYVKGHRLLHLHFSGVVHFGRSNFKGYKNKMFQRYFTWIYIKIKAHDNAPKWHEVLTILKVLESHANMERWKVKRALSVTKWWGVILHQSLLKNL